MQTPTPTLHTDDDASARPLPSFSHCVCVRARACELVRACTCVAVCACMNVIVRSCNRKMKYPQVLPLADGHLHDEVLMCQRPNLALGAIWQGEEAARQQCCGVQPARETKLVRSMFESFKYNAEILTIKVQVGAARDYFRLV